MSNKKVKACDFFRQGIGKDTPTQSTDTIVGQKDNQKERHRSENANKQEGEATLDNRPTDREPHQETGTRQTKETGDSPDTNQLALTGTTETTDQGTPAEDDPQETTTNKDDMTTTIKGRGVKRN